MPDMDDSADGELFGEPAGSSEPFRADRGSAGWKRPGFLRRHKALTTLLALFALLAVLAVGGILFVNSKLGQIEHVPITLPEAGRPAKQPSADGGEPLNILLAGADNGNGPSISAAIADGSWTPGEHRSDTIIILHISGDRKSAFLISVPRDSYVKTYDDKGHYVGTHKINAAFSLYGPSSYVSTLEHLTGVRMDHLAIIDWDGFENLTDALGGVKIYVPQTVQDSTTGVWRKGFHYMFGAEALRYVRTRHGLAGGDFDRIRRQQNFLRVLMSQVLSKGTLTNPLTLSHVLDAATTNLTVDSDWSSGDLRNLALSLRNLRTSDITFLSAPIAADWNRYVPGDGDVVLLDDKQCQQLWQSLANDSVAAYASAHPADQLPDRKHVN